MVSFPAENPLFRACYELFNLYPGGIWKIEGLGSCSEVGLQYVVRSPAELVILVRTGVFSFTLLHISVTVGSGGFGISGVFGG